MEQVYYEQEHYEVFAPAADPASLISLQVPGTEHPLPFYICALVPVSEKEAFASACVELMDGDNVSSSFPVGTDVGACAPVASRQEGYLWVPLARLLLAKGEVTFRLSGHEAGSGPITILLCTWARFWETNLADDWLDAREDSQWALRGVPLGGVGAGQIELCADGRFRQYTGNNNDDLAITAPGGIPGAYLAIGCEEEEYVLSSRPAALLEPVPFLASSMSFPQVGLMACNIFDHIMVEVTATSPLALQNDEFSCLPGFVLRWDISNQGDEDRTISCRLAWPNLVGYGAQRYLPSELPADAAGPVCYWESSDGRTADIENGPCYQALKYGNVPSAISTRADGHIYVGVSWERGDIEVHADPHFGFICKNLMVPAMEQTRVEMAVAWEMPHQTDSDGNEILPPWRSRFHSGADVLMHLFLEMDDLFSQSQALHEQLSANTPPYWVSQRFGTALEQYLSV